MTHLFARHFTLLLFLLCALPLAARAQQPFYTDDADVTPKGKFHFEFSDEYDALQHSLFPTRGQNTADSELDFGLGHGVEVGIESPLIAIRNARGTLPTAFGIGDTNLSAKYNFIKEDEGLRHPAFSASLNVELPTGDASRSLGSGLTDVWLNGIMQKSVTRKTKLRLNSGILFAGNTTTGVVGIKTRGKVFTFGASLVKQYTKKFDFGAEISGALAGNLQFSRGQLQTLVGGNYAVRENFTLDFGVIAGRYSASPRLGAQFGISYDF